MSIGSRTGGVLLRSGPMAAADAVRALARGRDVLVVVGGELGPRTPLADELLAAARGRGLAARVETLWSTASSGVLVVALPGLRRPRRIARAWLGAHVVLVTTGTATSALAALLRATGDPEGGEPGRLAARMAEMLFASLTVVVDASARDRPRPAKGGGFGPLYPR